MSAHARQPDSQDSECEQCAMPSGRPDCSRDQTAKLLWMDSIALLPIGVNIQKNQRLINPVIRQIMVCSKSAGTKEDGFVEEYSRIIIEYYCRTHRKTKKSEFILNLVELSYTMECEPEDWEGIQLERYISQEKNPKLKSALEDLNEFLFC